MTEIDVKHRESVSDSFLVPFIVRHFAWVERDGSDAREDLDDEESDVQLHVSNNQNRRKCAECFWRGWLSKLFGCFILAFAI